MKWNIKQLSNYIINTKVNKDKYWFISHLEIDAYIFPLFFCAFNGKFIYLLSHSFFIYFGSYGPPYFELKQQHSSQTFVHFNLDEMEKLKLHTPHLNLHIFGFTKLGLYIFSV